VRQAHLIYVNESPADGVIEEFFDKFELLDRGLLLDLLVDQFTYLVHEHIAMETK
jgi:hypothetical protein